MLQGVLERLHGGGGVALAAAGLALALAQPVSASPDTFRNGFEDVVLAAGDIALAPVQGGIAAWHNMSEVSDNGFLQGLYLGPAFIGLTGLQAAQGVLRAATGAVVELIPGIFLFPFPDADVPRDVNVFRRGRPLVEWKNPMGDEGVRYVPVVTPVTIDGKIAPMSPWAMYDDPADDIVEDVDGAQGSMFDASE